MTPEQLDRLRNLELIEVAEPCGSDGFRTLAAIVIDTGFPPTANDEGSGEQRPRGALPTRRSRNRMAPASRRIVVSDALEVWPE